jgi:hypothetical protein
MTAAAGFSPGCRAAAQRLLGAYRDGRPCAPVRELIDAGGIEAAYGTGWARGAAWSGARSA